MELGFIEEFPGYVVSSTGDVYSLARKNSLGYSVPFRKLKSAVGSSGYTQVVLNKGGKQYCRSVHRLVAEAFVPNPDNLPTVNHEDLDKSNNSASNLTWMTQGDNNRHARGIIKVRKVATGGKPSKPVEATHIESGVANTYPSVNACARAIGGFSTNVSKCLKGAMNTYKGYTFKYV